MRTPKITEVLSRPEPVEHDPFIDDLPPSDLPAGALSNGGRGPALRGRRRECHALDRLLESVRAGASRVLVLRGTRGVGKSALLEYLVGTASGVRLMRAAGVESEMELPYAGLHQLCAPILDFRDRLPVPQRDALESAFGLSAKPVPPRLVVGLAALGLLGEVAEGGPLVCVVDDAQWLDGASVLTLAFVARRLSAASIGFVLAVHEPCELKEFTGLPELLVGGLSERDARALLDSVLLGRLAEVVRDRIVSESRGTPLTLLELARDVAPGELAGGFAVPDVMLPAWIDQSVVESLASLPLETRQLLLIAAAEPLGDASLLWRAARLLGFGRDAAAPAQAAGLVDIGALVRFRHPSLRSVVYHGASPPERREAHRALAEATDSDVDPDRRAWHRAHATDAPEEDVAAQLELSAGQAAARGDVAAAAAFLGLATELTPDPLVRGQRALDAAERKAQVGEFDQAISMLTTAATEPLDDVLRARLDLTRGRIALARGRSSEACPLLLATARLLESLDVAHAREAYLDALSAAMLSGDLASSPDPSEVAQAAREATRAHDGATLAHALAVRFTDGYAAAAPIAKQAVESACDDDHPVPEGLRRLWLKSVTAADLWDDERWDAFSARHAKIAREAGVISELPLAFDSRVFLHLFAGELAEAANLAQQAHAVRLLTGSGLAPYAAVGVTAWRGRDGEARELIEATLSELDVAADGTGWAVVHWASAVLSNGLGRYEEALTAAVEAAESRRDLSTPNWGLIELIEASARCGRTELATESLDRLSEMTRASGTDWALGVEARSRALLGVGVSAERLYREAIERLQRTRMRSELGRAHLLYGEWLRRESRRVDSRAQLRAANELFATIGMEAFAGRARRELLATGANARKRVVETRDELTAQEHQIAQLARDGCSNAAIGAQLFLSPRTVEWHLRKVFSKLGIRSRYELASALPGLQSEPVPA